MLICDINWTEFVGTFTAFVGAHAALERDAGCHALHMKSILGGDKWKIGACDVFGHGTDNIFHALMVGGCYSRTSVDRHGVGFLLLGRGSMTGKNIAYGAYL